MPQKHRVRNWSAYNIALRRRGDLFLYFDEDFFQNWHFTGKQKRGGQKKYNDAAIEMILTIKNVLRLPLRQAQGFVQGLARKLDISVSTPDFSTISRRAKALSVKIKQYGKTAPGEALHLLIDSTGLSVYSGTYFHTHKHLKNRLGKRTESWRKLHIAYDVKSSQVISAKLTSSTIQDAAVVEQLIDKTNRPIASITGDKAYDKQSCYKPAYKRGAKVIVPPQKTGKQQSQLKRLLPHQKALESRDRAISFCQNFPSYEEGIKEWKKQNGYHKRSLIEAVNHRFKKAFGFSLTSKTEASRETEVMIKLNIINKQRSLGEASFASVT